MNENPINSFREFIRRHWQPAKIEKPEPDPDLDKMDGVQRSAEVFRYSILSLEFWLSPNGRLREWLRLNSRVSSILLIPAILVVPLVTFILWQIAFWISSLFGIMGYLILLPLATIFAIGILAAFIAFIRIIVGK